MPRQPRFGAGIEKLVFDRQRTSGANEGVDAIGVGFEHRLGVIARHGEIRLGGPLHTEGPHQAVFPEPRPAGELRPAAERPVAVVVHVPEPILGRDEALGEERVVDRGRPDVRNAPAVAHDIHGLFQTGQTDRRCQVRQRRLEIRVGDGHVDRSLPISAPMVTVDGEQAAMLARQALPRHTR